MLDEARFSISHRFAPVNVGGLFQDQNRLHLWRGNSQGPKSFASYERPGNCLHLWGSHLMSGHCSLFVVTGSLSRNYLQKYILNGDCILVYRCLDGPFHGAVK